VSKLYEVDGVSPTAVGAAAVQKRLVVNSGRSASKEKINQSAERIAALPDVAVDSTCSTATTTMSRLALPPVLACRAPGGLGID
jgi:hypothetical protein